MIALPFSNFVEIGDDANPAAGILREAGSRLDFVGLPRSAEIFASNDFGIDAIADNALFEGSFQVDSVTGTSNPGKSLNFLINDLLGTYPTINNGFGFDFFIQKTPELRFLRIWYAHGGTPYVNVPTANLYALGQRIYWRSGICSAIGDQFGAYFLRIYNDPGKLNLLEEVFVNRPANYKYRFANIGGISAGGTGDTMTGFADDFAYLLPAKGENLANFIEVDPAGKFIVYPDIIKATGFSINSATANLSFDYGVNHFGDYKLSCLLDLTSFTDWAATGMFELIAVANSVNDALLIADLQGIQVAAASATTFVPYIHQNAASSASYSAPGPVLNAGKKYSLVLERSGSTLTMRVFRDLFLENFLGNDPVGSPVVWTGKSSTPYRYYLPLATVNHGGVVRTSTFNVGAFKKFVIVPVIASIAGIADAAVGALTASQNFSASIGATADNATANIVVMVPLIASINATADDASANIIVDSGDMTAQIAATADDASASLVASQNYTASIAATADNASANIIANSVLNLVEYFSVLLLDDANQELPGQTVFLEIHNSLREQWDAATQLFRPRAGYKIQLDEVGAADVGQYNKLVNVSSWNDEITAHFWYVNNLTGVRSDYFVIATYLNGMKINSSYLSQGLDGINSTLQNGVIKAHVVMVNYKSIGGAGTELNPFGPI